MLRHGIPATKTPTPWRQLASPKTPLPPLLLGRRPDQGLDRCHRGHLRRL